MAAPKKNVKVLESESEVTDYVCSLIQTEADKAIQKSGIFTIGVSGGSLAKFLCNGLPNIKTDWKKWRVFFCDERLVPFDDEDSTFKYYKNNLIGKVELKEDQLIAINPSLSVEAAALDYVSKIKEVFVDSDLPRFDILLLGMGPDGHTCSLFPGHKLLKEDKLICAPISDSPKPPACRVTLTYPVLNNSANVVFVSTGAGKADMIKRVLEGNEADPLPAARVLPSNGELYWVLDKGAAANLAKL